MLVREQDEGAQWGSAAPLPGVRVSLQRLHSVSLVSIIPSVSPPPCGEHRPFQLSACPSESIGTLVISLPSHASSLKGVRSTNEGTGDPKEEESPRWAVFWRRGATHRQGPSTHPADAQPLLLEDCWAHVLSMCRFPRVTQTLTN